MVKNEADIVEHVIRHLFGQGVDHVLIADNLSTDRTWEILQRLSREFPVHTARDRESAYFQSHKMNLLANAARKSGAEWIIPFDADEMWFSESGTIASYLHSSRADVIHAQMYNLFPSSNECKVGGTGWRLQVLAHHQRKVAFRTHPLAALEMGNHSVSRPGETSEGLNIVHIPWRSWEQFRRKGLQGGAALAATNFAPRVGYHWRHLSELGEVESERDWSSILRGDHVEGIEWSPVHPGIEAQVWTWRTWDPEGLLS